MCDLSDPYIIKAYTAIIENEPNNWLLLGYNDTKDVVSLYSTGTEGISEFREHLLVNEVLYGFLRMEGDDGSNLFVLITWVSDQLSGVRKARALVHSRSVASLLKHHHAHITASTLEDLNDSNLRVKLSSYQQEKGDVQEIEEIQKEEEENLLLEKQAKEEEERIRAEQQRQQEEQMLMERQRLEDQKRKEEAQRLEQERFLREKEERERLEQEEKKRKLREKELEEEKKLMQFKLLESEKNKSVILSGFVSVQSSMNPFWRRRYFVLRGKSMAFYSDDALHQGHFDPLLVLDLNNVNLLRLTDMEIEACVRNSFILETELNGGFQMFADDKRELHTILNALQSAIQ